MPPDVRNALLRELGAAPADVLARVEAAGVRVWVAPDRVVEAPADRYVADGQTLAEAFEAYTRFASGDSFALPPPEVAVAPDGSVRPGQTLEDTARDHGARAPEEQAAFVSGLRLMNPGVRAGRPLRSGVRLYVLDVWMYQNRSFRKAVWNDVMALNRSLEQDRIDGLYMPSARRIVLLRRSVFDPSRTEGRDRVSLHELGHAFDFAMREDPTHGEVHRHALESLYAEALERDGFLTEYSRTNPVEYYADGFEAYFTRTPTEVSIASPPVMGRRGGIIISSGVLDASREDLEDQDPGLRVLIEWDMNVRRNPW